MSHQTALITGAAGLIGSETARLFDSIGLDIHGIDNNSRQIYFGPDGDVSWNLERLQRELSSFTIHHADIRDADEIERIFKAVRPHIVVHCAAQPAHEYARQSPTVDFHVNVTGTVNLLEACRKVTPEALFVFCSSSKVYGRINGIPYQELESRFDFAVPCGSHGVSWEGINEDFPTDGGDGRGIYGSDKAAADVLVQEYGRTYGMQTVSIRGNCMTGSGHSPAELHGFLAYLAKCLMEGRRYTVFGFGGKQVRDIIHSADFASAIMTICLAPPKPGSVYNLGGGRGNSVSIVEAVHILESVSGRQLNTQYLDLPRHGDHRVYITDTAKFRRDYPEWKVSWDLEAICADLLDKSCMKTPFLRTA